MEEGRDTFYVVRKGNTIGVYKSFSDCQAQVSSSVCDPSVSVYKGSSLTKEAEKHLSSCGLKNAFYTIDSAYVDENLFGNLVPCPFQQPEGPSFSTDKASKKTSTLKRPNEVLELDSSSERVGSTSVSTDYSTKQLKVFKSTEAQPVLSNHMSCILEFDGASKGNPGKSGAGAVLRTENGQVVARLREGLGVVTNNVAEYRAVILGLKYALMKGFKHIRVQGDSQLVCMQVQDKWQTKNMNMADLCKEVKELKDKFLSFQISHVRREFNSAADAQANLAINLQYGQIHEEPGDLQ